MVKYHVVAGDIPDEMKAALVNALAKHDCERTLEIQMDRVEHFKRRIGELGKTPADLAIVLINVDDPIGREAAASLMPDNEEQWSEIRARGETPYARGLVVRSSMVPGMLNFDPNCVERMRTMETVCIVIDHGTLEVFEV